MRAVARTLIGFAVSVVTLLATEALAQKVSYDYRPQQNFARIKTFAFKATAEPQTITERATTYDSPLMKEHTEAAVAHELTLRGIRKADENPDVFVTTLRTFRTEVVWYGPGWYPYGPYYDGYWGAGYGWDGWYGWGPWYSQEILVGTLTIDVDTSSGDLIWRGVGVKDVHSTSNPAHRIKRVDEEVRNIFKKFPVGLGVRDAGWQRTETP